MSEQQPASACPHPEAVGTRWGDPISEERQAELQGYLDRWTAETDHGERKGPFDRRLSTYYGGPLTGADVSWLVEQCWGGDFLDVSNLHLEGAVLAKAHLERAHLNDAHLQGAFLIEAHLAGADLSDAHLQDAKLSGASFDKASRLNDAVLTGVSLDQVTFDNVNLTVLDWGLVDILGDEREAHKRKRFEGTPKTRQIRLADFKAAARANRVLAVALQAQGLSEDSDRFAYRAQVLQRRVLRLQGFRKLGAYLFSLLLAALAGYGFRIWRIFASYALIVAIFAAIFFWLGIPNDPATTSQDQVLNALLVSLTAIHGRTFFEQFAFTPQGWVAAIESIVGIVIEGVFVAMLIQRFFGK